MTAEPASIVTPCPAHRPSTGAATFAPAMRTVESPATANWPSTVSTAPPPISSVAPSVSVTAPTCVALPAGSIAY